MANTSLVKTARSPAAIDRATPARLWGWCAFIVLVGVAARVLWFVQFEHELPFAVDTTQSGHGWAGAQDAFFGDFAASSYDLTRAFAPGYGAFMRALSEIAGGATATAHAFALNLLVVQTGLIALTTLISFALARRVLFGFAALVPPALITLSIGLIELAGGLAPQIPLMFLVALAIWQITILRERLPEQSGPKIVLLTISAGFTLGAAILFNPAVLLLVPLLLWWAFRGLGTDHAILLLVAVLLLPATWLAIVQTQTTEGIPTAQAEAWVQQDAGNLPSSLEMVGDRAYAIGTPWNARFARGTYSSSNWNYEWILPVSVRSDSSYQAVTRGLIAFFMVLFVAMILLGVLALFAEGAGSAARLLALPVIALPFATFLSADGNTLRIPMLPFLMIALTLGWIWLSENLRPYIQERRAPKAVEWT
ncbi:MAG: hypothetical protein ACRDKE_10560 [Solirubrobacterales bacterium]